MIFLRYLLHLSVMFRIKLQVITTPFRTETNINFNPYYFRFKCRDFVLQITNHNRFNNNNKNFMNHLKHPPVMSLPITLMTKQ